MSSHPSCCNFSLLGNLFQQVVIELDYSVSKSQAFGMYRFTDLTHIVFFLNQCYESSELPHRDSVCA